MIAKSRFFSNEIYLELKHSVEFFLFSKSNSLVNSLVPLVPVHWFQLLKCEYVLLFSIICNRKFNILGVWTVDRMKQTIYKLS